jgi:outer membrane protein assembly factor BamE (lipoprotein component of BamABCDE complex)
MNISKSLMKAILEVGFVGALALTASFGAMASDGDRITQLEKEVQELKRRLTNLERPQSSSSLNQKPTSSTEGWKNLAAWRSLKNGMSYDDVRAILGEPQRIDGGRLTYWFYPNRSSLTFYLDKLDSWSEPK